MFPFSFFRCGLPKWAFGLGSHLGHSVQRSSDPRLGVDLALAFNMCVLGVALFLLTLKVEPINADPSAQAKKDHYIFCITP